MTDEADFSSAENFAKSLTPDLFGFLFAIPALTGLGDFWYLSDDEEKELSESGWLMVSALPKSKRKVVEKWVSTYLPIIMFILTFGVITGKRVSETYKQIKAARPKSKLYSIKQGASDNEQNPGATDEGETEPEETGNSGSAKRFLSDPISKTFSANPGGA